MNYKRANKEMQQATLKILQERTDIRNVQDRSQTLLAQAAFIADDAALSASVVWNGARESSAPATSIAGSTNEPQTREQQLEAEVQRLKTQLAAATPRDSSSATKSPAAQQKEGPPKLERSGTWVQVGDRRISKASWDALQQVYSIYLLYELISYKYRRKTCSRRCTAGRRAEVGRKTRME
jgi:hypothetical protein